MEGTYPLLLDGAQAGEVCVSAQGAWTLFEARCAMQPGIVRISVYGGGREGYLGVLAPEGEELSLRRKLSRSALREFPAVIEYAARAGEPAGRDDPGAPPEEPVGRADPGAPPEEPAGRADPGAPEPDPEPAGRADPGTPDPPAGAPAPPEAETQPPPDGADLYWYATPDGALVAFDGAANWLALPPGDDRIPADGGEARNIDGWSYVVFREKKGQ